MKSLYSLLILLSLGLTSAAQVPSYVAADGLVGWYPFSGNANDESGVSADGELFSLEAAEDRFGNANSAFYFSGSSCTPHIETNIDFQGSTDGMTISYWLNRQGNGCIYPRLFGFWSGGNNPQSWGMAWSNSGVLDYMGESPANDQWHHILVTLDADSIHAYLNGELKGTYGSSKQPPLASYMSIGRMTHPAYDAFNGYMDDFGIWNRVLNDEEIQAMYESNDNPSITGCMDEAACNFDPEATEDDGSCNYCECVSPVLFGGNWNDVLISFGTNQLFTTWEDLDLSPIQGRGIRKIVGGEGYFLTLMEDSTVVTLCENCLYGNPPPSTWKVKDVEAGRHEGVLVRADGSLYSFGANYAGLSSEPTVNNAVQCAAASWFHMALLEDGDIVGWGNGWAPCPLELENVIKIDASGNHAVALLESGKLVEWGKLDDGTIATSKDWILELNNVIDAIAGQSSTWIIFNDGSATRVSFPDGEIMMELPASSMTISGTGNWFSVSGHMNANGDVFVQKGGTQIDTTLDLSVYASCDVCIADTDGDGVCNYEELFGCTDEMGCNYSSGATQNANCVYPFLDAQDCMEGAGACGQGTHWDVASQTCVVTNPSDSNFDGCVQLSDLLDLLSAYGACEWQCGDAVSYQGYDYETVLIGEQCWFAENARYLPAVSPPEVGSVTEPHAYVFGYSGNDVSEAELLHGAVLYNGIALSEWDICPSGWHVPSEIEWQVLESLLGMSQNEIDIQGSYRGNRASALKSESEGWQTTDCSSATPGTDEFGFGANPVGIRHFSGGGTFTYNCAQTTFWSSTDFSRRALAGDKEGIYRSTVTPEYGFSVRCMKDAE